MNEKLQQSAASLRIGTSNGATYPESSHPQQINLPPCMLPGNIASNPSRLISMLATSHHGNFFGTTATAQSQHPPLLQLATHPQHQLTFGGGYHPITIGSPQRVGQHAATGESPSRETGGHKKRSRTSDPFPVRLHRLLIAMESQYRIFHSFGQGLSSPQARFVRDIVPTYFRQKHLNSFKRQLNVYGFDRVLGGGTDNGAFFHAQFIREQPDLCKAMLPRGTNV